MSVLNPVKPFGDIFKMIHKALGAIEESAKIAVTVSEALASPAGSQALVDTSDSNKASMVRQFKHNLELTQELKKQVSNLTDAVVKFNAEEV